MRHRLRRSERDLLCGGAYETGHHLRVRDQFAQLRLHMDGLVAANRLGQMTGESCEKTQLDHPANRRLQGRIARGARQDAVEDLDVAVDEDALTGNFDVVEDGERVLLVETRTERAVEVAAARVEGFAADELHPGSIHRQCEAQRIWLFAGAPRVERTHEYLVGKRRQGREHFGATNYDPAVGLANESQRGERIGLCGGTLGAIDLRIDQRMRQAPVVIAASLVVAAHVLAVALFAPAEVGMRGGKIGHHRVAEVRQPAHQAESVIGAQFLGADPYLGLGHGRGHQKRGADRLAGRGRSISQLVAM